MRPRRNSKTKILDQIIVVQVIVLLVLIGIYKLTSSNSDKTASNLDSYITPTPQVSTELSPTPILTVEPTIAPTTSPLAPEEDQTGLENDEDSNLTNPESEDGAAVPEDSENTDNSMDPTGENDTNVLDLNSLNSSDTSTNLTVPAFANGMSKEFIASLANTQDGTLLETPGIKSVVYYMQTDSRWANKYYGGTDTIEKYGCGPTSLSIVISSLTDTKIDPVQMCAWANEKDYWFSEQGSKHQLIPEAGDAFGLKVTGVENNVDAADKLRTALSEGKLVIALMGKGSFTKGGHFIVLRGITEDDMVYVADPNSQENTDKTWKLTQIVNEAKSWAGANGPFWIMSV